MKQVYNPELYFLQPEPKSSIVEAQYSTEKIIKIDILF
jgi:hypothetical protein